MPATQPKVADIVSPTGLNEEYCFVVTVNNYLGNQDPGSVDINNYILTKK